ncbi:MAG: universal stress protein [Solirubrobacterales bacterium]
MNDRGGWKARISAWLDSDLVGIPATLYTFLVLAISLAVFRFAGPVAGIIVAIAVWIPMFLFAIRGVNGPPPTLGVTRAPAGPRHRVLVVANQGLENPALCEEVCRRTERTATEAMIVAPVVAASRLRDLTDDVDSELELATKRMDAALQLLRAAGVEATGRAEVAGPMEAVLDGLREFGPNEVVMLSRGERGWESATEVAARVRSEVGLPVTEVSPSAPTTA